MTVYELVLSDLGLSPDTEFKEDRAHDRLYAGRHFAFFKERRIAGRAR